MELIDGKGENIYSFLEDREHELTSHLAGVGSVLLRGFTVPPTLELDQIARNLRFTPFDTYIPGIAPRKAHKVGNSCVFTSTEAPPHLPILPHTEMTYWPSAPDVLMFQCQHLESVDMDSGETVLFDTRKAASELGPELVALLEQGSIFQRFYPGRFDPGWDVADSVAGGSSWQRAFATTDAKAVEAMCRKNGASYTWVSTSPGNPPDLVTMIRLPWMVEGKLVLQTPLLGHQAYQDIIQRFPGRFDNPLVWGSVNAESVAPKVDLLGPDMGAFLGKEHIQELLDAIWKHATLVKWEAGDILILDNKNTAHARMNVTGKRKIVAVMARRN